MKTIGVLKNVIQEYAWGSRTAISSLLGLQVPSANPQAELWMGAHPKAPSRVRCGSEWMSLADLIRKNPEDILGSWVAKKFNGKLPYLFKVLAAEKPLSIQAHPNPVQAREGFERENRLGIAPDAPERNYKDDNHKPECICALTPFWALNGFRKIWDTCLLLEKTCSKELNKELGDLKDQPDSRGLKRFFGSLMTMDPKRQQQVVSDAVRYARKRRGEDPVYDPLYDPVYEWIVKLHSAYPNDPGVLFPMMLNLVCLKPGQAMYLPAGEPHAYLDGLGIELMANSDNVLRGGLTPKHVDVPELLKVLNFEERDVQLLSPHPKRACEREYSSRAEEFVLSVVETEPGVSYESPENRSIEILICTRGAGSIIDSGSSGPIDISKGVSVVIPSAVEKYRIEGDTTLYKASVPM